MYFFSPPVIVSSLSCMVVGTVGRNRKRSGLDRERECEREGERDWDSQTNWQTDRRTNRQTANVFYELIGQSETIYKCYITLLSTLCFIIQSKSYSLTAGKKREMKYVKASVPRILLPDILEDYEDFKIEIKIIFLIDSVKI